MITKRTLFVTIAISFCGLTQAQFKVDTSGKVSIMRSQTGYNAKLGVGEINGYTPQYYSGMTIGIQSLVQNTTADNYSIALYGEAMQNSLNSGTPPSIGLWGTASGYYNFGVVGTINPSEYGVGVFGSTEGDLPPYLIADNYAGYFLGNVCVDGNFSTVSIFNTSDMRLKENVVSLSKLEEKRGSSLHNLLSLDVFEYDLKTPKRATFDNQSKRSKNTDGDRLSKKDERRHYGVSAQELQKLYPDLVREGQDGYLSVNYIELVPILIRSLQELQQQLNELRGEQQGAIVQARQTSAVSKTLTTSTASLHPNTPNPFTERTTISFTLPDDAKNAYIYIFDMQGKMMKQLPVSPSMQSVTINGYELQAGLYLYSLVINGQEIDTKRMILSK